MGKLRVGQKVKIAPYEVLAEKFGKDVWGDLKTPFGWNPSMNQYCGKVHTIVDFDYDAFYDRCAIKLDSNEWSWSEAEFESIEGSISNLLEEGRLL